MVGDLNLNGEDQILAGQDRAISSQYQRKSFEDSMCI